MTLDTVPGDPTPMTPEEARALTDRLQEALGTVWELLLQAHTGGAWKALGYETWEDYCHQEFATDRLRLPVGERRQAVAAMREEGMTVREVAAALGVSTFTVSKDHQGVRNLTNPDDPDDVVEAEIVEDEEDPWANAPEADPPEADDTPPPPEPFLKSVRRTAAAIGNLTEKLAKYQADPRYNRNAQHVEAILVPALDLLTQEIDVYKESLK